MNSFSRTIHLKKHAKGEVPDSPTNLFIVSSTESAVLLSFTPPNETGAGPLGITSYTVRASKNGSPDILGSGPASPVAVTGLTSASLYTLRVVANNKFGLQSVPSVQTQTYTLHPNVVGTLVNTRLTQIKYTANGHSKVTGTSVNSGTNFIDRTFGLQLNEGLSDSPTATRSTYMSWETMTNETFRNADVTFYMKFKFIANTIVNDRAFCFAATYRDVNSYFMNLAVNASNWQISYKEPGGTVVLSGNVGVYEQFEIYHAFVTFNKTTHEKKMFVFKHGTTINTVGNISSSSVLSNMTFATFEKFGIGKSKFVETLCSNIVLYYANVLPFCATLKQMQDFSSGVTAP